MNLVLFYHSFASCWNHGNAHFLRGVARALVRRGHEVTVYEPADGWSRRNALLDGGADALAQAAQLVPGLRVRIYDPATLDLDRALDGADVVIAHEWNDPDLIHRLGRHRRQGGHFRLLFHDTHHRAVTAPHELDRFDLEPFDAVLAFGEVLREVYLARGWGRRVVTWHEAADAALFKPQPDVAKDTDLLWIGNWGDGERDRELEEFLLQPVSLAGLSARVHGVRYPEALCARLARHGIAYGGWLPNQRAPAAFARARATIHIPRQPYRRALAGIPTIRVFEALACGIPLASAPWDDAEGLFRAGSYLTVGDGEEAAAALHLIVNDDGFASEMAALGLQSVLDRHTCEHRVEELFALLDTLGVNSPRTRTRDVQPQRVTVS